MYKTGIIELAGWWHEYVLTEMEWFWHLFLLLVSSGLMLNINFYFYSTFLIIKSFNLRDRNKCHGKVPKVGKGMLDFVEDIFVDVKSH